MPSLNWENPLGVKGRENSGFAVWIPNRPLPPVDLALIREEQKALLGPMRKLHDAATATVEHVRAHPAAGGQLLVRSSERDLTTQILYRMPDHPHVLRSFGPLHMNDYAVVLSADHEAATSILDEIFPPQRVPIQPTGEKSKAFLSFQQNSGLIERVGLGIGDLVDDKVVVYPRILELAIHWIENVESPIFDLAYVENTGSSEIDSVAFIDTPRYRRSSRRAIRGHKSQGLN